jgi:flagellar hook-basal body complex protein FliE
MSPVNMHTQSMLQQMRLLAGDAAGKSDKSLSIPASGDFGQALSASLERINDLQQTATSQAQAFQAGAPGVALYDVMIDSQEASLALQMGVQMRNRLVDAYKQVMNMQV